MGDTEITLESVAKFVQSIQTSLEASNHNMTQMNQNIATMSENMTIMKNEIINTVNGEISQLKESFGKTIENIEEKVRDNTVTADENSKAVFQLVKKEKRNNIIIYNFPCNGDWKQREASVLSLFQNTLQTSCTTKDIDFIKNLRKTPNSPVLVGLTTWRMKMEILSNRKKLKDSKISLDEDYTPEIVKKRKELKVTMKRLKEEGFKMVQLRHATLYVDGKPWDEVNNDSSVMDGPSQLNRDSSMIQKLPPRAREKLLSFRSQNRVGTPRPKPNKRTREGELGPALQRVKSTKLTQPSIEGFVRTSVPADHSQSQSGTDTEDFESATTAAASLDSNLMDNTLIAHNLSDVTSPNESFNSAHEQSNVEMSESEHTE